jgi:hypothetical protein
MPNSLITLFETDANHSNLSKTFVGVFTSKKHCIDKLRKHCKAIDDIIDKDDEYNLEHINQTQNRSTNYIIEEIIPNTLDLLTYN